MNGQARGAHRWVTAGGRRPEAVGSTEGLGVIGAMDEGEIDLHDNLYLTGVFLWTPTPHGLQGRRWRSASGAAALPLLRRPTFEVSRARRLAQPAVASRLE